MKRDVFGNYMETDGVIVHINHCISKSPDDKLAYIQKELPFASNQHSFPTEAY